MEQAWLDKMEAWPNFEHEIADHFSGSRWHKPAREIRRSLEYVRHLAPEFAERPAYRWRSSRRSSEFIKTLTELPVVRTRMGIRVLGRILALLDRAAPRPPAPDRYLADISPDVLALCDYGHAGSLYSAYVEAAAYRGIPSAICVASWDNLSTRQLFRVTPDTLLVWNDEQVKEAVTIHGIPSDRIVVTGAQCFDHWFDWQSGAADAFLERVGLEPGKPYVLWVGGALNPSDRSEADFVRDWIEALRESDDRALQDLGVLLRPHPKRLGQWLAVDYSDLPGVALWPREGMTMPTDEAQRADYYDSIFHSVAVVGINSSAMIEAAIVGRPVLGIATPEFRNSHAGTFHFSFVTEEGGGPVRTAASIEEHLGLLGELLAGGAAPAEQRSAFLARFLRPHGLDRAATPLFVDALERVAAAPAQPAPQLGHLVPARGAIAGTIVACDVVRGARWFGWRLNRTLRRRARRLWSALRQRARSAGGRFEGS